MTSDTVLQTLTGAANMNLKKTPVIIPLLITVLLSGCQRPTVLACPYATDDYQPANAGCLITRGDEVLVVTMKSTGKQSLPGGTSEPGETARCTAFRETLEEAGIQVTVHKMLAKFDNGFQLYRCEPVAEGVSSIDAREISDVSWRSWLSLNAQNWRFPKEFKKTRQLIREQITGISKELEQ